MKLTVLGSGTPSWHFDKATSCYLLDSGSGKIMLDCGSGAMKRCRESGVDIFDIDVVVLSHTEHPDHSVDFPSLLFALNYKYTPLGRTNREKQLLVFGPQGTQRYYQGLLQLYPLITPRDYELRVEDCEHQDLLFGNTRMIITRVFHGDTPAVGCRVEQGNSTFAYSGDTGWCDELIELFSGVDLGLVECSLPDGFQVMNNHLNAREVGQLANTAGVRKLLITHQYPIGDLSQVEPQIRENYEGEIVFIRDHDVYMV